MKKSKHTKIRRIVILGAGFAGIHAYAELHKHLHNKKDVSITLISDKDYFLFVTLLHEVATGSLLPLSITQPIRSLSLCCVERFIEGEVCNADFDMKTVDVRRATYDLADQTKGKKDEAVIDTISYDYLVSALGSAPNFFGVTGARKYAKTLKTQADAKAIKNRFIDNFAYANEIKDHELQKRLLHTAIIGGGPTGVELAGELADYINKEMYAIYPSLRGIASVTLYERGVQLLPHVDPWFDEQAQEVLCKKKNVKVAFSMNVSEVKSNSIIVNEKEIFSGLIIWTAGVKAQYMPISASRRIDKDPITERIKVNSFLQLPSYENVFVLGDQASVIDTERGIPYPMRAQFASRQGVVAADNINSLLYGRQLREFAWKDRGFIVSLGKGGALAQVYNFKFSGWFAWWVYRTVYASKIVGARAKIRTIAEWTLNLFYPRDISKL